MLDLPRLRALQVRLEADWAGRVLPSELADRAVERRREEHRLPVAGKPPHETVDLRSEAHVEHPVGLVEDEQANVREIDQPTRGEIFEPARCRDEDMRRRRALRLGVERAAAVDGGDPQALGPCERLELGRDLDRQLACGHENECGRTRVRRGRPLDDRKRERERLARARG